MILTFGLILMVLYFVCVMYPFHFDGYADLPPGGFYYAMEPLGITKYSPVGIFSYFLSSPRTGPLVVIISIAFIIIGTLKKATLVKIGFLTPAVIIAIIAFVNMERYEIFGLVFE